MGIKKISTKIKTKTISFFKGLVLKERSPKKLALSFAMGVYIAICPFIGLHTAMIFAFAWMFRLNTAVTFATGYIVNNPFSLVPIFAADYGFGYWLLHKVFHFKTQDINPSFVKYVNDFLYAKLGIPRACFWSFIIGGNLLAVILAIIAYFVAKPLFIKLSKQVYKRKKAAE